MFSFWAFAQLSVDYLVIEVGVGGRLDATNVLTIQGKPVVLDVAHNPQKLTALTAALQEQFPDQSFTYVVALGNNKQEALSDNLRVIQPSASRLIATRFTHLPHASISPEHIQDIALSLTDNAEKCIAIDDPYTAFSTALTFEEPVVITGSFYLIDGLRTFIQQNK